MTDPKVSMKALLVIAGTVGKFQDRAVQTHLLGGSHRKTSDPARSRKGWAATNARPLDGADAVVRELEAAGFQITRTGSST